VVTQLDTSPLDALRYADSERRELAHRSVGRTTRRSASSLSGRHPPLRHRPGRRLVLPGVPADAAEAEIDTVEIDPVVRDLALEYFLYRESERVRTVIADGRVFLAQPGPAYDLIVLDAFNSTGVPFHLTTREFFVTLRRRLSPDGILAANFVGQPMGEDGRLLGDLQDDPAPVRAGVRRESAHHGRTAAVPNLIVYATVSADPQELDGVASAANWRSVEAAKRRPLLKLAGARSAAA
jgi:hypothetical protein